MKKTIQIYMASTTFTCTEEAYEKLSAYLEELRTYFVDNENKSEVLQDIETRIAEKLIERKANPVTMEDVMVIMSEIGDVADLTEEDTGTTSENNSQTSSYKKLYRDSDNAMFAGVASGLGTYLNIEPILFRIVFVVTTFFGGAGIFAYILLWILIPKAKTASQKLEMRGQKVTLDALENIIKEGGKSISKSSRGAASWLERLVKRFWHFFTKAFGGLVAVGSFFAIIGFTTLLGIILLNWNQPFNDLPFKESSSLKLLLTLLISGYFAVILPLIFITALGVKMLFKKKMSLGGLTLGLAGLWAVAVITAGVSGSTVMTNYYAHRENNPEYRQTSQTIPLDNLEKIIVHNAFVTIVNGTETKVTLNGRTTSIENIHIDNQNGILNISKKNGDDEQQNCFFCFDQPAPAGIVVTAPNLSQIELADNGIIKFNNFKSDNLEITIDDAQISGKVEAETIKLTANDSWSNLTVYAGSLTVNDESDSHLNFVGKIDVAAFNLSDSYLDTTSLEMEEASITATDSHIIMTPMENLESNIDRQTRIENR